MNSEMPNQNPGPFEPGPFTQEKGTMFPAGPRSGWVRRYLPWIAAGFGAVLVAGFFAARYYFQRSIPFRVRDGNIILKDSHGGEAEIDTTPELPDGFPSDVPIFPGATLHTLTTFTQGGSPEAQGSLYLWSAPAPLEDVAFWYLAELEAHGWELPTRTPTADSVIFVVRKESRGFVLTLKGVSSVRTEVSAAF